MPVRRRRSVVVIAGLLGLLLVVAAASAASYHYKAPAPGTYAGSAKPSSNALTQRPTSRFPVRFGVKGRKLRKLQIGPTKTTCLKPVVGAESPTQTMTVPKLSGFPQTVTAADAFTYVTWSFRKGKWTTGGPSNSAQKLATAAISFSYVHKKFTGSVSFNVYLNDAGAFDPRGDWICQVNSAALVARLPKKH